MTTRRGLGIILAGAALLVCVFLAGCGSAAPSGSVSPSAGAQGSKKDALAYVTALQRILVKDDALYKRQSRALDAIGPAQADPASPAGRTFFKKLYGVLLWATPIEREIASEYAALLPPPAFSAAHAMLVALNEGGLRHAQAFSRRYKGHEVTTSWMDGWTRFFTAEPQRDRKMVATFRAAATKAGVTFPIQLLLAAYPGT